MKQAIDYMIRIDQGEQAETAVRSAFQRTFEDLDAELRAYRSRERFQNGAIRVDADRRVTRFAVRQLALEESLIVYLELALDLGVDPSRIHLLIDDVAEREVGSMQLVAAMALLKERQNKTAEADALLSRIETAPAEPSSLRTQVLIGDTLYERADRMRTEGPEKKSDADALMARARAHYRRALVENRYDIEAAHSFALTCLWLGTEYTRALEIVDGALQRAPANTLLLEDLALIYARLGDSRTARQYWIQLYQFAQSPPQKEAARAALAQGKE